MSCPLRVRLAAAQTASDALREEWRALDQRAAKLRHRLGKWAAERRRLRRQEWRAAQVACGRMVECRHRDDRPLDTVGLKVVLKGIAVPDMMHLNGRRCVVAASRGKEAGNVAVVLSDRETGERKGLRLVVATVHLRRSACESQRLDGVATFGRKPRARAPAERECDKCVMKAFTKAQKKRPKPACVVAKEADEAAIKYGALRDEVRRRMEHVRVAMDAGGKGTSVLRAVAEAFDSRF